MIDIIPEQDGNIVNIPVSEYLEKQDYELFVPRIDGLVREHGKIRILFDLDRFNGWNTGALWFGIRHFPHIERVAFVGDRKWQHGIDLLCKPFTKARFRHFEPDQKKRAAEWLKEG